MQIRIAALGIRFTRVDDSIELAMARCVIVPPLSMFKLFVLRPTCSLCNLAR
jgi:hypothetical protein